MHKKRLHHLQTKLRAVSYWYFLAAALLCSLVAVFALRNNNLTAVTLRDEVIRVDQENGDVETALKNLREYVYGHMNTDLASGSNTISSPVQLKYRYERLVAAEKERVSALNAKVYSEAQTHCEQQIPTGLSGRGRVPCIEEYVTNHGVAEEPVPDSLYKFNFVAPFWSPDLAGWSIVLAISGFGLFVLRLLLDFWLRYQLRE